MTFQATVQRVTYEELPAWMYHDVKTRLPLYTEAPPHKLSIPDCTSWTYFKAHFEQYLKGD
eukprot:gene22310-8842_t